MVSGSKLTIIGAGTACGHALCGITDGDFAHGCPQSTLVKGYQLQSFFDEPDTPLYYTKLLESMLAGYQKLAQDKEKLVWDMLGDTFVFPACKKLAEDKEQLAQNKKKLLQKKEEEKKKYEEVLAQYGEVAEKYSRGFGAMEDCIRTLMQGWIEGLPTEQPSGEEGDKIKEKLQQLVHEEEEMVVGEYHHLFDEYFSGLLSFAVNGAKNRFVVATFVEMLQKKRVNGCPIDDLKGKLKAAKKWLKTTKPDWSRQACRSARGCPLVKLGYQMRNGSEWRALAWQPLERDLHGASAASSGTGAREEHPDEQWKKQYKKQLAAQYQEKLALYKKQLTARYEEVLAEYEKKYEAPSEKQKKHEQKKPGTCLDAVRGYWDNWNWYQQLHSDSDSFDGEKSRDSSNKWVHDEEKVEEDKRRRMKKAKQEVKKYKARLMKKAKQQVNKYKAGLMKKAEQDVETKNELQNPLHPPDHASLAVSEAAHN